MFCRLWARAILIFLVGEPLWMVWLMVTSARELKILREKIAELNFQKDETEEIHKVAINADDSSGES